MHFGILRNRYFLRIICFSLGIFLLGSCAEEEKMVVFTEPEAVRLLSGDTIKSWNRVAFRINGQPAGLDDCELQTVTAFYLDQTDSMKFLILANPVLCGGTADTLEAGYWRIIGREGASEIADKIEFVIGGDTTLKDISMMTSLFLTLTGSGEDQSVEENFEVIIPE